jgi:hypothetical protein
MSTEKNSEIWSTRLQRELLALTTDNASQETTEEVKVALPPFVKVEKHELNIEKGDCIVAFKIDLPSKKKEEGGDNNETTSMIVTLNASLKKKADGSVDQGSAAYPFLKPLAILSSGASAFPEGSTIKDHDLIDIEIDWTPSLHLTDAILNIALKIKECILQNEPFHPAAIPESNDPVEEMAHKARKFGASVTQGFRASMQKAIGSSEKKKKKLKNPFKKSPTKKADGAAGEVRIGQEINMLEAPWVDCQGVYSCKAIRRPKFVEEKIAAAELQGERQEQVRDSIFDEDDGDVPNDISDYMKMQAGSIGQVCLSTVYARKEDSWYVQYIIILTEPIHFCFIFLLPRLQMLVLQVLVPCSAVSPSLQKV